MAAGNPVRNVALVGPNGTGKTTLLESLLFVTGAINRKGKAGDGNTVGDASTEARERQMSTEVNAATMKDDGTVLTILDCPGSIEFAQEARNALLGVDAAVVVVEPVVERMITVSPLLKFLDAHQIPHLVFINKMDRSEVRYRDLIQSLRDLSDRPVIPHQYAIGRADELVGYIDLVTEQAYSYNPGAPSDRIDLPEEYREREHAARTEMLETLADFDDELMEMLLEEQEPPAEDIMRHLQKTLGRRSGRAGVHGRGRARHGRAPAARGAAQGDPGTGRDRRPGRRWIRAARPWSRCSRPITCRIPASCRWSGCGRARSRTAWRSAACGWAASTACSALTTRTSGPPVPARSSASAGSRRRRPGRR